MKPRQALAPIALALAVSGCQTMDEQATATVGRAEILFADGSLAGRAMLYRSEQELTINIALNGLAPDEIDLGLNASDSCPAGGEESKFLSAIPSAKVGPSGSVTVSALLVGTPNQLLAQLFDGDGSTITVRQSGGKHSQLACGIIREN